MAAYMYVTPTTIAWKIDAKGIVTTVAGKGGEKGYGGDGGKATKAL